MTMENKPYRKPLPPIDVITSVFDVDTKEGTIRFHSRPREQFTSERIWISWNNRFAGQVAGSITKQGYHAVRFGRERYLAHRIIWKIWTGGDEPEELDHIDRNPLNNSVTNLRAATRSENNRNKALSKYNTTGFVGIYQNPKGKWVAQIKLMGRGNHLGLFETIEEAIAARAGAEVALRLAGRL